MIGLRLKRILSAVCKSYRIKRRLSSGMRMRYCHLDMQLS